MTVVHLISSEGYYGAENMMLALAKATSQQGHAPVVALFCDGRRPHVEAAEPARRLGLPVELVPCRGRWDWRAPGRIRSLLERYGAHVLHTHGYKADVYGYAAARRGRAALVATCHNWPDRRPLMRAYAVLDRILLRRFDRVAAASEPVAAVLRRSGVAAVPLPNGVETGRFRQMTAGFAVQRPPGCDRLAGFVGRLTAGKGGEVLLEAAREVVAERPASGFVFVGEGPRRAAWEALAAKLGLGGKVVFTGALRDMPAVYASLDLLVLPSYDEALPMCVLEAMAAGRPVVATRVGSVPRAVVPGVTGFLFEPGDAAALARAILCLMHDPALARRLGAQSRGHVAQHFSSETMAAAYLDLYQQALAHREDRR